MAAPGRRSGPEPQVLRADLVAVVDAVLPMAGHGLGLVVAPLDPATGRSPRCGCRRATAGRGSRRRSRPSGRWRQARRLGGAGVELAVAGYEMPTMPTLLPLTHGWAAMVSTTS